MSDNEALSDQERWEKGAEVMAEVYGSEVMVPPAGNLDFADLMVKHLFGEVWAREELSIRDRRLLTMGVIAAVGGADTFVIQVRAALTNGELTAAQVRELLIHLAPYAGYPRVASLIGPVEQALAELSAD
jgi:4-carboxymuconolactone decarboxylase